jgi:hypothetical protein
MAVCTHLDQVKLPNRHASRHARADGHPVARSVEPGEEWSWCYVDEVGFALDTRD